MRITRGAHAKKTAYLQAKHAPLTNSPQVWKHYSGKGPPTLVSTPFSPRKPVDNQAVHGSVYTADRRAANAPRSLFSDDHEADLSAECTQTEAQARLPRAYVDACRPPDPQAPPGQGSEAPFGVSRCSAGIASPAPATSTMSTA